MPGFAPDLLTGHHAVVGSPGSGKTTLLRQLVIELERAGVEPSDILVLTPNRAQASDLRDQISLDSQKAAAAPRAQSISSFAFAQHRIKEAGVRLLSGSAQQKILRELVSSSPKAPWGFNFQTVSLEGFIQEIRDLITVCLEFNLEPKQLEEITVKTKGIDIATELLPLYLEAVKRSGALDPALLISTAPRQASFSHILVDDAHDFSRAGLEFVAELSQGKNLVLFGDPDAASLGFRTALPEGYLSRFPSVPKHYLEPRTKFSQALSKLSGKLPAQLAGPQRPKPAGVTVGARTFLNQVAEADWLAAEIRRARLQEDLSFSEMAVVARTRPQLEQLASALSARNVPVSISGSQSALRDQPFARAVLELLRLAYQSSESTDVVQLLESSLVGLDSIGIRRLRRQLIAFGDFEYSDPAQFWASALEIEHEPKTSEIKKLNFVIALLRTLRDHPEASAPQAISLVLEAANLSQRQVLARGNSAVARGANLDIDAALQLVAAANRFSENNLGDARAFCLEQLEQSIPEDSLAATSSIDAVVLTTASSISGRSFHTVFLPRLQDGIWPNPRPRTSLLGASSLAGYLSGKVESPDRVVRGELQDEIRLLYKAIGAASQRCELSAMISSEEQPSQFFQLLGLEPEISLELVSFDLRRLVGSYRAQLRVGNTENVGKLAPLALMGVPGAHPSSWQGLLPLSTDEPLVSEGEKVRFSPSKLEAFEKCPVHWFIESFGGDGSGFEASLGTLLHAAMEQGGQRDELVQYLESNWHTLEFESSWQAQTQKRKALRMLSAVADYLESADLLMQAEQKFELNLGRLQIAGKIDRVEQLPDGSVAVVDLKTGRTPSQAEVSGHRQLAVYQLAMRELGHELAGAKIVSVGEQKLKVLQQPPLTEELESEITKLLADVEQQAGAARFAANVSSHCLQDGNCQLLIGKVITGG